MDNNLTFNEFGDAEIKQAIEQINSTLSFVNNDNPLLEDCKASSKLLNTFKKRKEEIENLLLNHNFINEKKADLKLELKMIKQALDQNGA